jgi:hypothetical protein
MWTSFWHNKYQVSQYFKDFDAGRNGIYQREACHTLEISRHSSSLIHINIYSSVPRMFGILLRRHCRSHGRLGSVPRCLLPRTIHITMRRSFALDGFTKGEDGCYTVRTKEEWDAVVATGKPIVADFWAPWCGKCSQISGFVEILAEDYPTVVRYMNDNMSMDEERRIHVMI